MYIVARMRALGSGPLPRFYSVCGRNANFRFVGEQPPIGELAACHPPD
eukprot:COSAG06_NODE_266_length_18831_cov_301.960015_6_plen_48_part_00